jgi:hypothetical protein
MVLAAASMSMKPDPFEVRMIFLRIGWMNRYEGITRGDTISGGGAYIHIHGFGHEIFNFRPYRRSFYGYVQVPRRTGRWEDAKVNLTRLGISADEESVSGVLAVWVATDPNGGAFVVGWYDNATVFRTLQSPPSGADRRYGDANCGYYITARTNDAVLLPADARTFAVPQQEKGGFGQSNIWYADDPKQHREFRLNLLRYVRTRQLPSVPRPGGSSAPRRPDKLMRLKVERVAVMKTVAHFEDLGYSVASVERDRVGWDLKAISAKRVLKLEVKGLSGSEITVELTRNEYSALQQHRDSYRICVVTNAVSKPRLSVFAHSRDSGRWEDAEGNRLEIEEVVGARCSISR